MSAKERPVKGYLNKTKAQLIEELETLRREREDFKVSPVNDGQLSSSAHASKILEIADDAIISMDGNSCITFFNRGAVNIFGFTREEAIDQPIDILLPEDVRKIHGPHVKNFAQAKEDSQLMGQRAEMYGLRKNGERFPIEASISKSDVDGKKFFTVILRDISLRKRAEEELRVSQRLLKSVVDSVPHTIVVKDRESRYRMVNRAWCEFYGVDPKAAENVHSMDIPGRPEHDKRQVMEEDQLVIYGDGLPKVFEHTRTDIKGRTRYLQNIRTPIENENGEIEGLVAIALDITERKRAEEELHASQRLLRSVVDAVPHWVYVKDPQSRYMLVNKAMADTFGVSPQSMIGLQTKEFRKQSNIRIGEADDLDALVRMDREVIDSLEAIEVPEFTLTTPEGNLRIHHIIKLPITNESGAAVGVVGISEDITQRKAMEQHLQESQKLEAVGQLAGGIAHEFNNMLQVIINGIHFVRKDFQGSPSAKKYLDIVLKSAERSAEHTSQLLAYSRKTALKPTALNLNRLTSGVIDMVRTIIGENIVLELKQADDLFPVKADANLLEQTLINLCVNARDAMPDGGRLIFETRNHHADQEFVNLHGLRQTGDYAMLSVSDDGVGMSSEIRERIFEPFFTTKEVGQGTGLGLAMVHGVVQQHDGVIEALSEPGVGSTFNIYLPKADSQEERKEVPVVGDSPGGSETILLAEDEEDVLDLLTQTLESGGYRVLAAKDGEEALSVFKANAESIDLVILDMVMPRSRGRDVYEQIRESGSDVPVVISSGYSFDSFDAEFTSGNGLRTIQKPYAPDLLFATVREVLDEH